MHYFRKTAIAAPTPLFARGDGTIRRARPFTLHAATARTISVPHAHPSSTPSQTGFASVRGSDGGLNQRRARNLNTETLVNSVACAVHEFNE